MNQAVHVFADEVPVRFKTQYLETGRVAKIAVAVPVDSVYTLCGGVEEEANLLLNSLSRRSVCSITERSWTSNSCSKAAIVDCSMTTRPQVVLS